LISTETEVVDASCEICGKALCRSLKTCPKGANCRFHHPDSHSIQEVLEVAFLRIEEIVSQSKINRVVCCRFLEKLVKLLGPFNNTKNGLQVISTRLEEVFVDLDGTDVHSWALRLKLELARNTNSEYDPAPYRQLLERNLELAIANGKDRRRSIALMDLIKFIRIHEPHNTEQAWKLAEQKLEFEIKIDNQTGQGITLDEMSSMLNHQQKSRTDEAWLIFEKKLSLEILRGNLRGQLRTLGLMKKWLHENGKSHSEQTWSILVQSLEVSKNAEKYNSMSWTLQEMLNWMMLNDLQDSVEAFDLANEGYHLNRDRSIERGQSFFLKSLIGWLQRNDVEARDRIWELLEQKRTLDEKNNDSVGLSKTFANMINWVRRFDSDNSVLEWNLIQEKWNLDSSENLTFGQRITLQYTISWLQRNEPEKQELIRTFMQHKLVLSKEAGQDESVHINAMALAKWYQNNAPQEEESLREYLEIALKSSEHLENKRYRAIALGHMRIWMKKNSSSATDRMKELMFEELEIHKQSGNYISQSQMSQEIINWLEKYEPENLDERWNFIQSQMELGSKIALDKGTSDKNMRISLRAAARFRLEFPKYQSFTIDPNYLEFPSKNLFEVLYHISTLILLGEGNKIKNFVIVSDSDSYIDSIIKQMLSFYNNEVNQNKDPLKSCLTLYIHDLDRIIYEHKAHHYALDVLSELDSPLIIDGPNVFHSLQAGQHNIKSFIDWLNALDSPTIIHLSLNSLEQFREHIIEIHNHTDTLFCSNIIPFAPEDVAMFAIAKLTKGRIVSNDQFRDEKVKFSHSIGKEFFERKLNFKFTDEDFICLFDASP
jgi:hypothetical protein